MQYNIVTNISCVFIRYEAECNQVIACEIISQITEDDGENFEEYEIKRKLYSVPCYSIRLA